MDTKSDVIIRMANTKEHVEAVKGSEWKRWTAKRSRYVILFVFASEGDVIRRPLMAAEQLSFGKRKTEREVNGNSILVMELLTQYRWDREGRALTFLSSFWLRNMPESFCKWYHLLVSHHEGGHFSQERKSKGKNPWFQQVYRGFISKLLGIYQCFG